MSQEQINKNVSYIDRIIGEIKQSMETPNWKPETSAEMRIHADAKRQMAAQIKIMGGSVRKEYR